MDWFLYDNSLRHERVNVKLITMLNSLLILNFPYVYLSNDLSTSQ